MDRKLQLLKYRSSLKNIFRKDIDLITEQELESLYNLAKDEEFKNYIWDLICEKTYIENN